MAFREQPYGELIETTARVMTWNLWGRFGPWEQRGPAIAEVLRQVDPDVVLLQECWCDDAGDDQAAQLAAALGLRHAFGGGELLFDSWGLGNAILARWPITDVVVQPLPALDPNGWGGLLLRAMVDGPRGRLLIADVALDWPPFASAAREHALRYVATELAAAQASLRVPLVVGGDFNAGPDSDELRLLTGRRAAPVDGFVLFDAWEQAGPAGEPGHTWSRTNPWAAPSLLPGQRIDHLLTGWPRRGGVGSVVAARLAGVEPVDGVVASDHYAVVADVRY